MEKQEIRSEAPFTVSGLTLVPLVKSLIYCREFRRQLFASGAVKPFGVAVFSEKEKKVLLVDDVSRTGATLGKAKELLKGNEVNTFVLKGKADYSIFEIDGCVEWPWNKTYK